MDILTLELFDVTVSEALREISRALEDHPHLQLRLLLGNDPMLQHNIQRFLERQGRTAQPRSEGGHCRIDVGATRPAAPTAPAPAPVQIPAPAAPVPAPAIPAGTARPILLTRSGLGQGQGSAALGRRLLLGLLRELEPAVPWLCLALEGLELLEDAQAMTVLQGLQAQGTQVRISRGSQLFPVDPGPFEAMEDSHWQRLAGRGAIVII